MKIRPAIGMGTTLDEAMQLASDIASKADLMAYLCEHYDFWGPTEENVTCEPYCYDERIGWDTHLICVDGKAALFSDGPIPEG